MPAPGVVADLGTGSGAIGLSLAAELPLDGTTVWITDVSDDALAVARCQPRRHRARRPQRHGRRRLVVRRVARRRECATSSSATRRTSPTGHPTSTRACVEWEPAAALFAGPDGLDAIRLIVAGAPDRLAADGWLVLEHGADQGRAVRVLLTTSGYRDVETRRDLAGHDRFTVARRPRERAVTGSVHLADGGLTVGASPRAAASSLA